MDQQERVRAKRRRYNQLVGELRLQQTLVQHTLQALFEEEGQPQSGPGYGMPRRLFYGQLVDEERPVSEQGLTFATRHDMTAVNQVRYTLRDFLPDTGAPQQRDPAETAAAETQVASESPPAEPRPNAEGEGTDAAA